MPGDCDTPSFGFFGYALWNPSETVKIDSGMKAYNADCNVQSLWPDGNTPALLYSVPINGGPNALYLIVFGIKINWDECV